MKKFKIAIIGPTFSGNKGAAAMLTSALQNLEETTNVKKFSMFSYYPKEDRKLNPFKKVKIFSATPKNLVIKIFPLALIYKILKLLGLPTTLIKKCKEIKALNEADILIDIAGVSFIDGREKYLPFNILTIWPAMLLDTPVVKYSQALGPFDSFLNKLAAKIFLSKTKFIAARGEKTEKYLKKLGLKNVILCADGAFSLKINPIDQKFAKKLKKQKAKFFKKKVVGICPSSVVATRCQKLGITYENETAKFIKYLIKKDYNILLVPHSIRKNTLSTRNNDLPVCQEIIELVNNKKACFMIDEEVSPQELKTIIELTDLFITSRFHGMISSLACGLPTLVCGWSHKYREVLAMFDIHEYAFSYRQLTAKLLEKKFNRLEKNQELVKQKIKKALPRVKKLSQTQIKKIKNLLEA